MSKFIPPAPPPLKEIAKRTNEIAKANGFDEPTWENLIAKLAFVGTELDEARDGAYGVGEDPFEEELADTAIRLLSVLDGVFGEDWNDRVSTRTTRKTSTFQSIETLLWPTLGHVFKAMEAWRHADHMGTRQRLELALLELWRLADNLGINLTQEIVKKSKKNEGRSKLHGKAQSLG